MPSTPCPSTTPCSPTTPRPPARRPVPGLVAVVLVTLVGLVAVACGSSGRDLEPPVAGAVSPTRSTAIRNDTGPFTLRSSAFADGGVIPEAFSCEGPSPELTWSGARPAGTSELALVVRDVTADGFVHWFVAGIGAGEFESPEGATPANVAQLPNGAGDPTWLGPCPPAGETHTYEFELLALGQPAALPLSTPGADAYDQIQPKVLDRAVLRGTFTATGAGTDGGTGPADTTTTTAG